MTLSALLCSYTCKQLLGRVWVFGRSKFRILGEKGLEPVTFLTELMNARLSERQASCKRADLVVSGRWLLKRAVSKQTRKLLEVGRLSEQAFALASSAQLSEGEKKHKKGSWIFFSFSPKLKDTDQKQFKNNF